MTVLTVGIDPGSSGAIAVLDDAGRLTELWDMPYIDGQVTGGAVAAILHPRRTDIAAVWIEAPIAMPGQSSKATLTVGRGVGVLWGVTATLAIPTVEITANAWKKAAGLAGVGKAGKTAAVKRRLAKDASRRRASELWPDRADAFARSRDDGRAEAALIARHGWEQTRG